MDEYGGKVEKHVDSEPNRIGFGVSGEGAALLRVVIGVRELLAKIVSTHTETDVHDAWIVIAARFSPLVSALTDPDYLADHESMMAAHGLTGPEMELPAGRFEQHRFALLQDRQGESIMRTHALLEEGAIIVRSASALPGVGSSAFAIANFCAALKWATPVSVTP